MFIIRKKLTATEITPADRRYNTTSNTFEYSPDGGTTWVDDPGSDPRHNDIFRVPAADGPDAQCDAAARIRAAFEATLEILFSSVNLAQFATSVLTLVLLFLGPVGRLLDVLLTVGAGLISIGIENIHDAFTEEVWDRIEEIIYCGIGADGQVTLEQRDAIMADIAAEFPGTIYNTLVNLVNLFGEVLMSNAGVEREETGDCDLYECGCTHRYDFTISDQGFADENCYGSIYQPWFYDPGIGWRHNVDPGQACIFLSGLAAGITVTGLRIHVINLGATVGSIEFGTLLWSGTWTGGEGVFEASGTPFVTDATYDTIRVGTSHGGYADLIVDWIEVDWDDCPE